MLKIFSTQLNGIFARIQENNEYTLEDGARMVAQTVLSGGTLYFTGKDELEAVSAEGLLGQEAFTCARELGTDNIPDLTSVDTVIAAARQSNDEETISLIKKIKSETEASIILIASDQKKEEEDVAADAFIDLGIKKGLVPSESGERVGIPSAMAGLFAYHALYLTAKEILEEYE